ncbi:hypothetical protein LCM4576_19125 [Mesorhizobium sp. LCM 4576]|nr:hypothetical protein LCM4576_19125 [Mesorhizobium sp. LCM 4576]
MLANIIDVANDIVVPESQNGPAIFLQSRCPRLIPCNGISFSVLRSVDLNDELLLRTSEVYDISGDRKLTPEA